MKRISRAHGFTLIELLIVVAIIAILAAIAVPNFLEAQTRSKVSRVKADLRSCATALEAYVVDNNHYPYEAFAGDFPHSLTTPVAYLSSGILDIFRVSAPSAQATEYRRRSLWYFRFLSQAEESRPDIGAQRGVDADYESDDLTRMRFGAWAMSSFGPDQDGDHIWGGLTYRDPIVTFYASTNGTISNGDVTRTQVQGNTNTN